MGEISVRRARFRRAATAAGSVVVLAGLGAVLGPAAAADAAVSTNAAGRCLPSSGAVTVHFVLGGSGAPTPGIAGVSLTGFDPGSCDGQPVTVTLSGNQAGDPNAPVTELLSTLDSKRDACTGATSEDPVLVDGGSITLSACPTTDDPQVGAYADLHDVTRLTVKVSGHVVPSQPGGVVLGEQGTRPRGDDGGAEVLGEQVTRPRDTASGILPFTGGPYPIGIWVGGLLVLFGIASILLDRLADSRVAFAALVKSARRRRGDGDNAP